MDKNTWNDFIKEHGPKSGSFLQSWEWGEFQKSLGRKVIRISENDFAAQVIKMPLCCGLSYLYIPKGPILTKFPISPLVSASGPAHEDVAGNFQFPNLMRIAKEKNAIFIRFEPHHQLPTTHHQLIKTKSIQPRCTLILNLEQPFEDTLRQMHPKTRYNIRVAERHGVEIKTENKFGEFLHLLKKTGERDKFRLHPNNYYKKMLETLVQNSDFQIKLWVAKYKNQTIAANLIGYFGNTATYLHGASYYNYRNLMAPHLLHWKIIKDAKIEGYKYYDWWGIDEKKWPGVTRFKKGFASGASPDRSVGSNEEICYPGTFDLPIKKGLYTIYQIVRKVKSILS